MSKPIRVTALVVASMLLVGAGICLRGCNRNRDALAKYKAELRAKGEKLSAEELGYPKPPEKSPGLDRLLAAANKLGAMRIQPSSLDFGSHTGPGQAKVVWASPQPVMHSGGKGYDWQTVTTQFSNEVSITLELREAVRFPPRYFYNDPTNISNTPKSPFVQIRGAAQWLGGDCLVALREHQVDRAALDLRALTQLAQFHREDLTLVSQMIRVAVAGLGLSVSWQALQAEGWNEELLAGLQKDWESLDLANTFETGMVGERGFGESHFAMMRSSSSRDRMKYLGLSISTNAVQLKTPKDYFEAYVGMPFWEANADADEMLFLQHHQRSLDSIRRLNAGVPWSQIDVEIKSHHATLNQAFSSPMSKYRYLFSAIAIANFVKAAESCVRSETQRRMTITVIALERYKLRSGTYPPNLDALVPQSLSAAPIDLMSAKPLCYRLNSDGTFTLYSAGGNGLDDGGDATSGSATNKFDLWSGRDAVWPVAAAKD
ncbi:MAG TPA: hypothetical protein VFZ59_01445 [Verrucomicrobiae bacterium]|nr:hypothetical protein [Verrucomicrobiae bacterium]